LHLIICRKGPLSTPLYFFQLKARHLYLLMHTTPFSGLGNPTLRHRRGAREEEKVRPSIQPSPPQLEVVDSFVPPDKLLKAVSSPRKAPIADTGVI
jgi:hypothetical protein